MIANARSQGPPVLGAPSDDEMQRLCEYFYRKTGIRIDHKRRTFLDRRIVERFAATESSSFDDYFARLKFDQSGTELQALINQLTVNETYFFREDYQFEALTRHMLDEVVRDRPRGSPVRIWSVPCSTGEEPYSLAILILERWARSDEYQIEIFASDIDSRVLAEARAGIYEQRSLARLSPELLGKYFTRLDAERWQVHADLRESIDFVPINISNSVQMMRMRNIDVIFCRNLLIYFDDTSRREAAQCFFDSMSPGGFICLGHSESMSRISPLFVPRKYPEALVHQRPRS